MATKMKTKTTLLIILFVAMVGCQQQSQQSQDKKTQMMLDSEVSGKNAMVVRPKEALRPAESVPDFKELSNITQHDIDALQKTPSKEIVYVKQGEPVRPAEKKQ